jgi:putative addiction module killer protein
VLEVRHYLTQGGRDPFQDWFEQLRDTKAKIQILRRINRLELGNLGDHKFCRNGVWELRINHGPGYRVYYAQSGETVILLLCAGDKSSQSRDIEHAVANWQDWQRRTDR